MVWNAAMALEGGPKSALNAGKGISKVQQSHATAARRCRQLCLRAPLARGLLAPQGDLEHRLQIEARAAEVDERDQTLGAVEAIRSAREGSNLPVHPLRAPVVEPQGDVREDALEVLLDGARQLLERL